MLAISSSAIAEEIVWRFNNTHVEKRPESELRTWFANRVGELSDGAIDVRIFHGDSLGVAKADILRALRIGGLDMSTLFPDYMGRDARIIANVLSAGVIFDVEEEIAILPVLQDIYRELYGEWNIEVVGWQLVTPWQLSVLCREPVQTLAEIRDKKVRVYQKGLVNIFRDLDIAAQLIPAGEFYLAMQTGVVDCGIHSVALVRTLSLQEVSDYASQITILTGLTAIGVNRDRWNELSPELQAAVKQAGEELLSRSIEDARSKPARLEQELAKELAANGEMIVLDPLPDEDLAEVFRAAVGYWQRESLDIGDRAEHYRQKVVKALEKYRAQTADEEAK